MGVKTMTPGFSMMGSGIYSQEVDREIVCAELCTECDKQGKTCDNYWTENVATDDWGNIEWTTTCSICEHQVTYKEEKE
jgi:hypothetical protein